MRRHTYPDLRLRLRNDAFNRIVEQRKADYKTLKDFFDTTLGPPQTLEGPPPSPARTDRRYS
jgi:hypothetical protein